MQLTKSGRTYEVRFVTKKGLEQDLQYVDVLKQLAVEMSRDVFGSGPLTSTCATKIWLPCVWLSL